ncbi:shikimate kinase [Weizmannia acidilactici]|uniref:Shikimate kinase n=1 Tax=Weizmannia acidilactici TaxID=2607726 RepID=A0A5J4J9E6_9BACI|nr:shikimate kinase [Weizmannia acidilactici]GER68367.1 shikimate kinase [Weizmannia acidilactici]GER71456.1 shikimate kinase [Weizmannia acidilactici]GER72782.1 shikimate kinase [Weizmannia acidilactici]
MTRIYLTGFMGAGKTTVGHALAAMLHMDAIDLDAWIEKEEGMAPAEIFAEKGEAYFRKKETEMLKRAKMLQGVIMTGGGIVMREENRRLLKRDGLVVFLDCDPAILVARIQNDASRPMASGRTVAELVSLYEKRLPLYRVCADLMVDTSGKTVDEIVTEIAGRIKPELFGHNGA